MKEGKKKALETVMKDLNFDRFVIEETNESGRVGKIVLRGFGYGHLCDKLHTNIDTVLDGKSHTGYNLHIDTPLQLLIPNLQQRSCGIHGGTCMPLCGSIRAYRLLIRGNSW